MPQRDPQLPEGTDHIVNGAMETGGGNAAPRAKRGGRGSKAFIGGATGDGTGGTMTNQGGRTSGVSKLINDQTANLKRQAADRARQFAQEGKTRASDALDEVARAVEEAADIIDERLGDQYGGYARRASGVATGLREREVDELYEEARDFVRTSPVLTVGVAAAVGFALVRLIRAGMPDDEESGTSNGGSRKRKGA